MAYAWTEITSIPDTITRLLNYTSEDGRVQVSSTLVNLYYSQDYGTTWAQSTNSFAAVPLLDGSNDASLLAYFALGSGNYMHVSLDEGQIFVVTVAGQENRSGGCIIGDASGMYAIQGTLISKTVDNGVSWTPLGAASDSWRETNTNDDGSIIIATRSSTQPKVSVDSGATWNDTNLADVTGWRRPFINGDGSIMFTSNETLGIFKSTNGGTSWTNIENSRTGYTDVHSSDNGYIITCGIDSAEGGIISTDGGASWQTIASMTTITDKCYNITLSRDGSYLTTSSDNGTVWTGYDPNPPVPPEPTATTVFTNNNNEVFIKDGKILNLN